MVEISWLILLGPSFCPRVIFHRLQARRFSGNTLSGCWFLSDIFEDLVSPTVAAISFLARACEKRKGVLDPVMALCIQILDTPPSQRDPSKKDGALHVIGQVSTSLTKVGVVCVVGVFAVCKYKVVVKTGNKKN